MVIAEGIILNDEDYVQILCVAQGKNLIYNTLIDIKLVFRPESC
jgi:hypothetical protein